MTRWLILATILPLTACVGAVWTDSDTGETETRVYTPLDLLPDDEEDGEEEI